MPSALGFREQRCERERAARTSRGVRRAARPEYGHRGTDEIADESRRVLGEVIADGRAHFADHCAICHGNDGSGDTPMGRGLYPKVPDMRLPQTQNLSDGELFWIIENGIRFTGMPAWSSGTEDGETASWHLVHFLRRLPKLTPEELEEMETLNPQSPAEIRQPDRRRGIPDRRRRQAAGRTRNAPQASRRTR